VITRRAIRWLADHDSRRPFFVWLHYFDPHDPYAPPYSDGLPFDVASGSKWTGDVRRLGISREQTPSSPAPRVRDPDRQRLVDLYDAEIHYLDQSLGDLIRDLESNGLYDDTLIVFTSDHAEAFGEHGFWTHGHSLHQSQIHVPLLIKLPQPHTRHEVRPDPVGLADLMTTLCGYLEFDCPSRETATNLLDDPPSVVHALWRTQVVAREGRWKLIHDELSGASQLFDLAADPDERHDIKKREPEIVTRLRTGKDRWLRATWPSYEQAIQQSRQQYRQLQALGYLE
jgi:arylsulfatase A-like enzyme